MAPLLAPNGPIRMKERFWIPGLDDRFPLPLSVESEQGSMQSAVNRSHLGNRRKTSLRRCLYNQVPWWQHLVPDSRPGLSAIWDNKCPFYLSWFESRNCQSIKTEAVYKVFLWRICHLAETKIPSLMWSLQTTVPVTRVLCSGLIPYVLPTMLQL